MAACKYSKFASLDTILLWHSSNDAILNSTIILSTDDVEVSCKNARKYVDSLQIIYV